MMKTLVATAAALAFYAGAAGAQQAYDSTVTQTTTRANPVTDATTTTQVQKSVDPYTGTTTEKTVTTRSAPTPIVPMSGSSAPAVTTYHEERTIAPGPATTERTYTTESVAPAAPAQQTTTWSQTTTTRKE